ncbi:hypothetical protein ACFQ9X_53375 [Catenulispora yoronensis]
MLAPLAAAWLIGVSGPGALWLAAAGLCGVMAGVQPALARRVRGEMTILL